MSFNICGQCVYFQRESHVEDEEQWGYCYGMPPQVMDAEESYQTVRPVVDPADRACVEIGRAHV